MAAALAPDDNVVATYREHGHALVRGVPPGSIMAEMFGKAEGCSRGRGGSMHLFDTSHRFFGGNALVGGGLPIAVSLAPGQELTALVQTAIGAIAPDADTTAVDADLHDDLGRDYGRLTSIRRLVDYMTASTTGTTAG